MNNVPLNVKEAMKTIKHFCTRQLDQTKDSNEFCNNCPLYIEEENGLVSECFFGIETPDNWEIEEEEQKGESK